ncbi:MAG: protein kinase [Polyangiaceae bacterium]|nr:protein kinase [Polyangiaceae bacterium]
MRTPLARYSTGRAEMPSGGDFSALERAGQHEAAAEVAERAGEHAAAARLWELACRWDRAALAALAGGDPSSAAVHAARTGDPALLDRVTEALGRSPSDAAGVARRLERAGLVGAAARVFDAAGDAEAASRLHEQAGALDRAASAARTSGDLRRAVRLGEAWLEREPDHDDARVAVAEALLALGRPDAAARRLQQRPPEAPPDARFAPLLARALAAAGMGAAEGTTSGTPRPEQETNAPKAATERILFGRYAVIAEVATTPTARVYRARDRLRGDAEVAVKVCSVASLPDGGRDAIARYEREARALGALAHPAIVPLVAWEPGGPAIVTAWMSDGSLAERLAGEPLAPAHAAEITERVLVALREAHRRGILHRDVKPANVLFDGDGAARLADFGVAHVSDAAATVTAGVLGTLAYMAPEQRAGAPATPASDIYGAGAIFWHALVGAPPSDGEGASWPAHLGPAELDAARRLVAPEAERPPDVDAALATLRGVRWPARSPPRASRVAASPPAPASRRPRLVERDDGRAFDTLLERPVALIADTPAVRVTLRAIAALEQPCLPQPLAWRPAEGVFWVTQPTGAPAVELTPAERLAIDRSLAALRAAGGDPSLLALDRAVRTPTGPALPLADRATPQPRAAPRQGGRDPAREGPAR